MANQQTNLVTQPQPATTRYNRVALYVGIAAVVLIVLAYSLVVQDHGQVRPEERKARLASLPKPLIPELPKATPQPPTEPPLKEQPVSWTPAPPPQAPPPAPTRQENPLAELRKKEWQEGLRSPLLVAAFSSDKQQQVHGGNGNGNGYSNGNGQLTRHPQTLEIAPLQQQPLQEQPWAERYASQPQSQFGNFSGTAPQYLNAQLQPPKSPYMLNAGMMFPVVLTQDVTSDVDSFFSAVVTRNVYDSITGQHLLVPMGSRITFISDLDSQTNQQPIFLMLAKTLYLPNGYSLPLQGMPAANGFGMTGVQDKVNRHFLQKYGSAAVLSLVAAGIRMGTHSGSGGYYYTPEDAAINGASQVMGQTIAEELKQKLRIKPTVVIRAGYQFNVTATQDIDFGRPYQQVQQIARGER